MVSRQDVTLVLLRLYTVFLYNRRSIPRVCWSFQIIAVFADDGLERPRTFEVWIVDNFGLWRCSSSTSSDFDVRRSLSAGQYNNYYYLFHLLVFSTCVFARISSFKL